MPTPHIIYAQIGFSTNQLTFNKNMAKAEKSPMLKPHKPYTNSLATIKNIEKLPNWELIIIFALLKNKM